ncbi:MAG: carbohydrate porin [Nitrospirae bacterium]|nr:carbohydrate porin [Nitrospirota bacterium]
MLRILLRSIIASAAMLLILNTYAFSEETPIPKDVQSSEGISKVVSTITAPTDSDDALPNWVPKILSAQINAVYQDIPSFKSPYEGDKSFSFDKGYSQDTTRIFGVYFGSDLSSLLIPNLQTYADIEMAKGSGVSQGVGLGGYINGDVIRTGSVDLGNDPYIAKVFMRYFIPLSNETSKAERGIDQLPGNEPIERIEIRGGKYSTADVFDQNRYANNTRIQFMNYSFITNPAYDYAGDTRGYSWGIALSFIKSTWQLTYAAMMVCTTANGNIFDTELNRARGDNLELTLKPNDYGTVVKLLTFLNQGRMGNYAESISLSSIPNVKLDEKPGRTKYGFGINLEQPITDDGETGLFARIGWNDGNNEDFSYTEVDRNLSVGGQISGIHWGRKLDHVGIALGLNGISAIHQKYLAHGGYGFLIGDGNLNYGLEQIIEIYYRVQLWKYMQISPDFQFIMNPGYNQSRGPVEIYGIRARLYF